MNIGAGSRKIVLTTLEWGRRPKIEKDAWPKACGWSNIVGGIDRKLNMNEKSGKEEKKRKRKEKAEKKEKKDKKELSI